MAKYRPKVGGSKWNAKIVEIRQANDQVMRRVEAMERLASNDRTKVLILETALYAQRVALGLADLKEMSRE